MRGSSRKKFDTPTTPSKPSSKKKSQFQKKPKFHELDHPMREEEVDLNKGIVNKPSLENIQKVRVLEKQPLSSIKWREIGHSKMREEVFVPSLQREMNAKRLRNRLSQSQILRLDYSNLQMTSQISQISEKLILHYQLSQRQKVTLLNFRLTNMYYFMKLHLQKYAFSLLQKNYKKALRNQIRLLRQKQQFWSSFLCEKDLHQEFQYYLLRKYIKLQKKYEARQYPKTQRDHKMTLRVPKKRQTLQQIIEEYKVMFKNKK